ncbi:SdpI family protein [Candidatus Pacearchaeota archaeon]|nr:hypothetical protein [uncultured archaeon]AQS31884.1 hypothetical protein [uncultured archaeon]MBS3088582.1 SdpI family protein [Candidatus Pacearchaeota archaeon]
MKTGVLVISGIILASFAIGIYFYNAVPEQMASHWNYAGEVDDYMSKNYGLFLMPVVSVLMVLLFIFIVKIDPLRKNIKKFMGYYIGLILAIVLFLFYLNLLSIFANLGYDFNMTQMMMPALGILFYFIGIVLKKAKRNWFVGIRTPWTLSSDKVWDKTHLLGSRLFKIAGVISFAGIILPGYAMWFAIVPVLTFSIYLIVYSYFLFRKLKR